MSNNSWARAAGDCKTCLCKFPNVNKSGPTSGVSPEVGPPGMVGGQGPSESSSSDEENCQTIRELCDCNMSTQLLTQLKLMREDEDLCDVVLIVGQTRIPAHRVVLAAVSPYFRKMFGCGFKEATKGEVNFYEIRLDVLLSVVNFIYTGKIMIDELLVDGLLDAADLFQLASLRNLCLWWLMKNLTPGSCLGIYIMAMLRSHLDLAERAKNYAIEHFGEVAECEEFLHLAPEIILDFLESPYLGLTDDGQLLKSLLQWTHHDELRRRVFLEPFLSKVNLEGIPPQLLIELIQHPVLSSSGELHIEKTLRDSLTLILSKKFESTAGLEMEESSEPTPPLPLRCFYQQDVILAIGGESKGSQLANVECFMMGFDGWKCGIPAPKSINLDRNHSELAIIPTMNQCRMYSSVASNAYSAFIMGGQESGFPLNIVERYNIIRNEWEILNPLPLFVHGAGAVYSNTRLYLIGGKSQNAEKRTWIYDEKSDSWSESLPMLNYRAHLGVSSFCGELFALGGIGGQKETDEKFLNSVEKYDPPTQSWTLIAPMHEERAFHSCGALEGFIYAIGGSNGKIWLRTAERYDTTTGQWTKVCNMSIPRSSFGLTISGCRLYCVGGYDGVHFLNSVEKYNPRTDRWHCVHAMQIDRYALGAVTLKIPLASNFMSAYELS